jgi:hypothetical protein
MKRYLPFLPIIILVVLFFLLASIAHGATSYLSATTSTLSLGYNWYNLTIQSFKSPVAVDITEIKINFVDLNTTYYGCATGTYDGDFLLNLYNGTTSFANQQEGILATSYIKQSVICASQASSGLAWADYFYPFVMSSSTTLTPNDLYSFSLRATNAGAGLSLPQVYFAEPQKISEPLGCSSTSDNNMPCFSYNYKDLNATLRFEAYPEATSYIDFVIPTATSTIDFDYWQLSYGFADGVPIGEGSPETGRIDIFYTGDNLDSSNVFAWFGSTAVLPKTWALGFGNWSATAYLYTSSSVLVASSTINFTINEMGSFYALPTSTDPTATSSCVSGNFFENGICYLFNALLVPSQNSVNRFGNLKATIISKPPIGYFYAVKNVILGFATTTATSTIPLQSLEPLKTGFLGDLRTGLQWLFWIVLLIWIFNRLRHLQL